MKKTTRLSRVSVLTAQKYSIVVTLLVITIVFASISKPFLTTGNLTNILLQASATALAAVGMTFVLVIGEIDISVGSLMSLAMTVAWVGSVAPGALPGQEAKVNALIYPLGILMGLALGCLNGLLINRLRINSFIATLAAMFAYRGIAWKMVGSSDKPFTDSPVMFLGRTEFLGIGLPVYLVIAIAAIASLSLNRTPAGRYLYAIGGSPISAVQTGLPVNRMRVAAFTICGACVSLAGLITIGQVGTLQAGLGSGFEFTVIAAVVLGGTSLLGGRASISGSVLGAVLLVVIDNGLNLINASVYIYDVIKGAILITSVVIDLALSETSQRMSTGAPAVVNN